MKRDAKGYYVKTFTFNGRKYYVKSKSKSELIEKTMKRKEELQEQKDIIFNPTLRQYYDYFSNRRKKEIRESTLRSQRSQIKSVIDYVDIDGVMFGERKIKDINRRDIERVRDGLYQQGKTPQNLNNIFAHLNHVFNSAFIDDTIEKNPCKALKPLKRETPTINETKHRALKEDEIKRFFQVAKDSNSYYYNDFLFMIKSGLRIGELTALTRADIDTKKGFIHITKTIQRDESGGYFVGDATKTKSGSRDIPLTDELLAIVKEQEKQNNLIFGRDNIVSMDVKKNLLFKGAEGNILREYSINREIKRICEKANIEKFTCHAFRNTFATRWIEQRPQDYKILSEILGHKDISITLNLYTHVMQEQKVNAMQKVMISVV